MKDTTKLKLAALCLGLAAAVLTIGWTQIISQMTGPYGHTITDGASGFTITGTTTMAYTAQDSVATKKIIATTTAGDSVIIYTSADKTYIVFSINGKRDSIWATGDAIRFSPTDTVLYRLSKTTGAVGSYLILGDTLMYVQGTALSADKILCSYSASGANVGKVGWFSIGPAAANAPYGRGLFGGAYETSIDTGCAYVGAGIGATLLKVVKYHPLGRVTNLITGGFFEADTGRFKGIKVAKDTTLEVALFTRTCTRDTLAYMTGADSTKAAYIVNAFATRGAITCQPYIAGVVDGKLVVDRPAADTASYDRYSVTKVMQR